MKELLKQKISKVYGKTIAEEIVRHYINRSISVENRQLPLHKYAMKFRSLLKEVFKAENGYRYFCNEIVKAVGVPGVNKESFCKFKEILSQKEDDFIFEYAYNLLSEFCVTPNITLNFKPLYKYCEESKTIIPNLENVTWH